ncbi:MAG: hypothetical protein M1549_01295 [Candidatus Dependentiae bacterium]|nr:hypothetical protein [Candidatus Dependentiae bacterium]
MAPIAAPAETLSPAPAYPIVQPAPTEPVAPIAATEPSNPAPTKKKSEQKRSKKPGAKEAAQPVKTEEKPEPAAETQEPSSKKTAAEEKEKTPETPNLIPSSELKEKEPTLSEEGIKSIFEEFEEPEEEKTPEEAAGGAAEKQEPFIVIQKNEKLATLIDKIAAKKGLNVILPQGADVIKETITFEKPQKMPVSKALSHLYLFLHMAGYRVRPDNGCFIISRLTEQNISREPLQLFVDVAPEDLPKNDSQIRAIYYLANFRVPSDAGGNDPLNMILKDILGPQRSYLFDKKTNAVIIVGSANKIASAMHIVLELDNTGAPDDLKIIPLYNVPAPVVAKLLTEQIIATAQEARRTLRNDPLAQEDFYVAPNTRVIADTRTNSLIVLGQSPAVRRIRDLVREYIDVPAESGKSVIHVHDVQYLKSKDLAEQLIKITKGIDSEQARKETGGPQKFFDEPRILPEEFEEAPVVGGGSKIATRATIGGNRLIVSATSEDWKQIKALIEQLDRPELQVILEIMVVDLTVKTQKILSSQTRNPLSIKLPPGFQFQSAQLYSQIVDTSVTPLTLDSDLLMLSGSPAHSIAYTLTSTNPGAMIVSLRDPGTSNIWSVLELFDAWTERTVLSHPFLVTQNNHPAHISNVEKRRATGPLVENNSVVATVKYRDFDATLNVDITPRISSLDRLNLQILVKVENFLETTGENKATRDVETNASLSTGQILVLGGLTQTQDIESESGWPLISRIPLLGDLFKGESKTKTRSNLAIFIHPTIVDPKLRSGMNKYTGDTLHESEKAFNDSYLFSSMRDPLTRIFLSEPHSDTAQGLFEKYVRESASRPKPESRERIASTAREREKIEAFKERIKEEQQEV